MLKRKLYTAAFIGFFLFSSTASDSSPAPVKPAYKDSVFHQPGHHFDTDGFCSCLPIGTPGEKSDAPRIRLNDHVAEFVKKYNKQNGPFLNKIKPKKEPYFAIIDSILCLYELPSELKYLAFIESGLKQNVVSHAGAAGPWALMPVVAKKFGLNQSGKNDERLDYYKSTHAAAKLLLYLYDKYKDWLLVIAAYNAGPGWVQKGIKRSGGRDYWKMQQYLPKETQNHIKRFIAVHYHFEGHGSLVTLSKAETEAHIKAASIYSEKQKPVADSVIVAAN